MLLPTDYMTARSGMKRTSSKSRKIVPGGTPHERRTDHFFRGNVSVVSLLTLPSSGAVAAGFRTGAFDDFV